MLGGDLIVAIDGENIQDQQDLAQVMNAHRAGDTVKVTVYRGKQKMDVDRNAGRGARAGVGVLAERAHAAALWKSGASAPRPAI